MNHESIVDGMKKVKKISSPSGNRTLVSRVTGGDTDHYTNEDSLLWFQNIIKAFTHMRGGNEKKGFTKKWMRHRGFSA